jgi:acyl-CoA thioester hydrolase
MNENEYLFELEFMVRDYECDLQGIVNNAVYQNYLEHTRHEFIRSLGISFAELHRQGKDAVAVRIELDYLYPLKSGDRFVIKLNAYPKGKLKIIFDQDILRIPDGKHILRAKVFATCLQNGKPVIPSEILKAIEKKKRSILIK